MVLEAAEKGGEELRSHQVQGHNLLQCIKTDSFLWCLQTLTQLIMDQLKLSEEEEGGGWEEEGEG